MRRGCARSRAPPLDPPLHVCVCVCQGNLRFELNKSVTLIIPYTHWRSLQPSLMKQYLMKQYLMKQSGKMIELKWGDKSHLSVVKREWTKVRTAAITQSIGRVFKELASAANELQPCSYAWSQDFGDLDKACIVPTPSRICLARYSWVLYPSPHPNVNQNMHGTLNTLLCSIRSHVTISTTVAGVWKCPVCICRWIYTCTRTWANSGAKKFMLEPTIRLQTLETLQCSRQNQGRNYTHYNLGEASIRNVMAQRDKRRPTKM